MGIDTAAGAKLYIGDVAAASVNTEAEYEALNFIEVAEIEDLGEFGDEVGVTQFTALNDGRVRKFKTSYDAGNCALVVGYDPHDNGQDALKDALATKFDYGFKVVLNNGADGSPSRPTTWYFRAKVTSFRNIVGNVENIVRANVNLAINSAILELDAV